MESSSARGNASEGNRLGYARSASMDSAVHPSLPARSSSLLSRRSSRQDSRGSISLSREMGDSILNSMRHSLRSADQSLGDVDSSVLAQLIESGDRVLAPEGDVDEESENTSEQHKVGPLPDYSMMQNSGKIVAAPVSSMEPKDTIAHVPVSSSVKVEPYKLSLRLDYAAYLIHLGIFGFFGVFTRYGLQKLFGPDCLALTSDQSPLYPDLPSNMLGSFLMGWFGIIFKADIRHISDHLIVGISTGYMGSLTTFSGWNQKMVALSSKGHWVYAVAGVVLGMFIVNESITVGVETGERLRSLILKYVREKSSIGKKCDWEHWRVDTRTKQFVLQSVMMILMSSIWVLSIVLAVVKVRSLADGAVLWLGCSVAPPGVWLRWYLARLNGQGIGKQRSLKWLPIGTLAANVLAAGIMAALAVTSKAVHTERSATILSGIQLGFLGCLSTVSTFVAEVYTMRRSGQIARAFTYAASTFLLSFVLGTLVYSVPVWVKHYG
ncbi:fluoride export protein 1 [Phragmites australis]|uniref:fluoride export protein 1 n=1 Tax=Phragmites australis TaxID=29695 RepID=UPI002D772397|nr:fluoride export protein 1 [Phragmites australis]